MRRDPVHEAMKGVVRIYARGFNETEVHSILDPRYVSPEEWVASGFFFRMRGEKGHLLTNSHAVRSASQLEIMSILTSDELFRVEVVGLVSSLEPDVAILKLPPKELQRFLKIARIKNLPYLKAPSPDHVSRGTSVKAIGYPLGMAEPNISAGEITNFIAGNDADMERLVTDAAINPGNSGGPAVTPQGRVIGINTAIAIPAANIGFITPLYLINTVLDELLQRGEATTSHLGATLQKNSEQNHHFLKMKKTEGVIVREVLKGSLAANLGLKARDVITAINAHPVDRHGNVQIESGFRKMNIYDVLHATHRSEPVILNIFRDGQKLTLKSLQVNWDRGYFPSQPIVFRRRFIYFSGFIIQEVCDEIIAALSASIEFDDLRTYLEFTVNDHRLIVTHIGSGTVAEEMGLSLGDLITRVNSRRVQTLEELQEVLKTEKQLGHPTILVEFASGAFACIDSQFHGERDFKIQRLSTKLFQQIVQRR